MQFPKNYLQPYGRAKPVPDQETVLRRLRHFNCEWLKRPKTAASELYSSISENLVLLLEDENCIRKEEVEIVAESQEMLDLLKYGAMFHRFAEPKGGMPEAKKLVQHLLQPNEQLDKFFSRAFLMGNALYTMATHWFVARTLMGNPADFAAKMDVPGHLATKFKMSRNLIDFLPLIAYPGTSYLEIGNESISDNIAHLLAQLGVPENAQADEDETRVQKRKRCESEDRSEGEREERKRLKVEENADDFCGFYDYNQERNVSRRRKRDKEPMRNKKQIQVEGGVTVVRKSKKSKKKGKSMISHETEGRSRAVQERRESEEEAQRLRKSKKSKKKDKAKRCLEEQESSKGVRDDHERRISEEKAERLKESTKSRKKEKRTRSLENEERSRDLCVDQEHKELEVLEKLENPKKSRRNVKRKRWLKNREKRSKHYEREKADDRETIKAKKVK